MQIRRRVISMVLMFSLLSLLLVGCTFKGYSRSEKEEVVSKGEELIREYLDKAGEESRLEEVRAIDYLSPETMKRELNGYVDGTFSTGDQVFHYVVNTNTGDVFTSERNEKFLSMVGKEILEAYGISYRDYDTAGNFTPVERGITVSESAFGLQDLLPVDSYGDLESYVNEVLREKAVLLDISILYTGEELSPERFKIEDTEKLGDSTVQICLTDENCLHPEGHRKDRDLAIARSSFLLKKDGIVFRHYKVCEDYAPFCLQYADYSEWLVKGEDGKESTRSKEVDAEQDIQFLVEDSYVQYYPYSKEDTEKYKDWRWNVKFEPLDPDMSACFFLKNLDANDDQELYAKQNPLQGWDRRNFAKYGDRYIALDSLGAALNLDCPNRFAFGKEAVRLLEEEKE
ncbi:MAG: hypothetical protein K5989_05435 [Lachnospiraceae bacterium]|nr:hypothetical protein [Lachnospiraceae bacterium]